MGKTRGKTSTASKTKYNEYAYARYTIRIRKDTLLYDEVEDYMTKRGANLNGLVTKLLDDHFFYLRRSELDHPSDPV